MLRKKGSAKLRFIIMLLIKKTPRVFLGMGKNREKIKNTKKTRRRMKIAMSGRYKSVRESGSDATEGIIRAGTATYMTSFRNSAA